MHPEAAKLGADLGCGEELYKDLQLKYRVTPVPPSQAAVLVQHGNLPQPAGHYAQPEH